MSISTRVRRGVMEESWNMGRRSIGATHISDLPESIISHILSCLSIKDAVRTCVLSKDWEYKWTSIYNIDIDDGLFYGNRWPVKTAFVDFVWRVLLLSHDVKKFRLSCSRFYKLSSRMTTWISAVLRRNVEIFDLRCNEAGIVFPRSSLHNSSSLRILTLQLPCTLTVPFGNCFLNLTRLCLEGVQIQNELSNTDTLILDFPVLKTFLLERCKWLNVKFVEICAPALHLFSTRTHNDAAVDDYSIKIVGFRLLTFRSFGGLPENIILNGSLVVSVDLCNQDEYDDLQLLEKSGLQFRRLLKEFPNLEELDLAVWVTEAISQSKQGFALPRYDKLRKLALTYGTDIEVLLELLHKAPYLSCLVVGMGELDDYDYNTVEPVPSCIVSYLEEIVFVYYAGTTAQVNLAKFVLKNGVKLKKGYVTLDEDVPKTGIMEQLLTFPRAPTCLLVDVTPDSE